MPVATPDSTRKLTVFRDRTNSPPLSPVAKTILQAISKMMTVLMAVVRFELIASTPILPKIVVNAAKNADSSGGSWRGARFCQSNFAGF